jgi:hypothetical protein
MQARQKKLELLRVPSVYESLELNGYSLLLKILKNVETWHMPESNNVKLVNILQ